MKKALIATFLTVFSVLLSYGTNDHSYSAVSTNDNQPSLGTILNEDGSIKTSNDISGSYNPHGYQLISKPGEAPRFAPVNPPSMKMAGDEFWENLFTINSIDNNEVYAIAVAGNIVYIGGSFTNAGGDPNANYIAKWDGTKWASLGGVSPNGNVYAIAINGTAVYAGGFFSTIGGVSVSNFAKWDGASWSAMCTVTGGAVKSIATDGSNVYIGGIFTGVDGILNTNHIAKWNGFAWTALGTGANDEVDAIVYGGPGIMYVGGNFTSAGGVLNTNHIAKWDGTWSSLGIGMNSAVETIAIKGLDVYAGGFFSLAGGVSSNSIAKWNGSTWSAIPGVSGGAVYSIKVIGTDVFAGGTFTSAGGVPNTSYIAKWDGTSWFALGSGLNNDVRAIDTIGTGIFAGGLFTNAGGNINGDRFAKWDQTIWQDYSTGINNTVSAIAVDGNNIYVGGYFLKAGGIVGANYIAKWDGMSWNAMGTGTNNTVVAIKIIGSNVFVGGSFTSAGGVPNTSYIARWDGSSWHSLGGVGLNNTVFTFEAIGLDLYIGGSFTSAGGILNANYIVKWNNGTWAALGSGTGLDSYVMTLKASGTNLYAGGSFTSADGNFNASKIARWDGTSWNALGTGLYYQGFPGPEISVNAIEVKGNEVYAGGNFNSVYGNPNFNYIAKWNGSSWDSLGISPSSSVYSICLKGNALYVGGMFTSAGGNSNATHIAKWENNSWSNLGSGINGTSGTIVNVIAADSNFLYTGGVYTKAGDKFAINFARYGALPSITFQPLPLARCVGTSASFSVHTNGSVQKTFQWKFNGSNIPLANDSTLIFSPVGIGNQGYYSCLVSNPCGSSTSDSVYLTVNSNPVPNIGIDTSFCFGDSVYITTVLSYSGYSWSTGSANSGIFAHTPGAYYVSVTDGLGCSGLSNTINVIEHPLPNVSVTAGLNPICLNSSTQLTASGAIGYDWLPSTGLDTTIGNIVTANPTSSTNYTVTGTDVNGCRNTASILLNILTPYENEIICEVNVDTTTGKNLVIWEKTPNVGIEYYIIYKESISGGVYNPVDTIPYDSLSVYEDMGSNAMVRSDRYKISILDTCGNESVQSPAHKTLHLTVNQGMGGAINLIWENYEGFVFGSYYIYRGLTPLTILPIDTIPNTITTYTDPTPPIGYNYYLIVIAKTDSCVASSSAKDQTQTYNTSVSNMEEYQVLGVEENQSSLFSLNAFPNPFNNSISISYKLLENTQVKIEIYNVLQEKVADVINTTQGQGNYKIEFMNDQNKLSTGVYYIRALFNNSPVMMKVIKL